MKAKCDVAPRVRQETQDRLTHATRFFDRLTIVEVVFSEEHNPRIADPAVVELTGRTKGHHIRAEGRASDHRGALDVAVTRFERQLARYKARMVDRARGREGRGVPSPVAGGELAAGNGHPSTASSTQAPGVGHWPQPRIVKRKRHLLPPMLPAEAAVQLELLDHDFFMFTNVVTGAVNTVYRRKDGDLGLIEPEDMQRDDVPGISR